MYLDKAVLWKKGAAFLFPFQNMMKAEQKVLKRFNKGCVDYHLLEDGDHILIALSGGKDSLELVRLLAQRARIYKPHIEVEAAHIIMDNIPYETDRSYLQAFCAENGIKLHILHSSFDESTDPRKTRCFLCAWNRRKTLFEFAVNNGFNKIALGHHMDDILVTLLMNITFEGSHSTMQPSLPLKHYPSPSSVPFVWCMRRISVWWQKSCISLSRRRCVRTRKPHAAVICSKSSSSWNS